MRKIRKLLQIALVCAGAFSLSMCIIGDSTGINNSDVTGREAKKIIRDKILANILLNTAIAGSVPSLATTANFQSLVIYTQPDILGISDHGYYKKSEVEDCASTLVSLNLLVNPIINVVLACSLKTVNPITGK